MVPGLEEEEEKRRKEKIENEAKGIIRHFCNDPSLGYLVYVFFTFPIPFRRLPQYHQPINHTLLLPYKDEYTLLWILTVHLSHIYVPRSTPVFIGHGNRAIDEFEETMLYGQNKRAPRT